MLNITAGKETIELRVDILLDCLQVEHPSLHTANMLMQEVWTYQKLLEIPTQQHAPLPTPFKITALPKLKGSPVFILRKQTYPLSAEIQAVKADNPCATVRIEAFSKQRLAITVEDFCLKT